MNDYPTYVESLITVEELRDKDGRITDLTWESRALDTTVQNMEARIAELEAEKNKYYAQSKKAYEALGEEVERVAELEAALRPIAECFENQENTDALIADFGYYSKQAARALEGAE